jgi:hypothetical protein
VTAIKRLIAGSMLGALAALSFPLTADAVSLLACMTAHKEEMKALNTQIAELQKIKVTPGGPNTKPGECTERLQAIHGSVILAASDKNSADHREKISCLGVKKTLLEQRCACEAKGLQFSADLTVVDNSLAAYRRYEDAHKHARRAAKDSPELKKISEAATRLRGCYSAQAITELNKSSAALEKLGQAKR